jgi:phosphoribosylaminoimidazolecarboxamide formyltransferase/IMP cyclohydrolase
VAERLAWVGYHRGAEIRGRPPGSSSIAIEEDPVELRYGSNPDQLARATLGAGTPVRLVSGHPSYINVLDALGAWQLVREASALLAMPVATTFKHVSPAGAATAGALDEVMRATWCPDGVDLSDIATAYVRARDCDPKSSFGDIVAVSEPVDDSLAEVLRGVVSDGIIAPGYEPGAVEVLAGKKNGQYLVLEADASFEPPAWETRELCGVRLEQQRSTTEINATLVRSGTTTLLPESVVADLILAMVAARHTQSNTVTFARDGMVLGIGAGQQSRVDCTRLAGAKVDTWWLRRHPKVRALPFVDALRRQERINWQIRYVEGDMDQRELDRFRSALDDEAPALQPDERQGWLDRLDDVVLASDGYIPFRDNIDQAARHGVRFIADPGGSTRNHEVETACAEHNIVLTTTGVRLFLH